MSTEDKLAAGKRKVEEAVGGASSGQTMSLGRSLTAGPSRTVPPTIAIDGPRAAVAEERKNKSPRVELPRTAPEPLVPAVPEDGVKRRDIGPAPLQDLGPALHEAASSNRSLLDTPISKAPVGSRTAGAGTVSDTAA